MGGSLAMALAGKCAALYGIDSDPATLELALARKIVDQAEPDPAVLLPRADLVVLATPVPGIVDFLVRLPSFLEKPCIVLDLGSTKKDILQAMSTLPERFDPIGGHPICGKEKSGLENAEAGLFRETPFVISPLDRTTSRARDAAAQIISAVGARLIEMDAESHDRTLALTSHFPFLLASAFTLSTPAGCAPLIGSGFRSTSRLAGTPSSTMLGILQSNREHVLKAFSDFQQQLSEIQSALISEDFLSLENILDRSRSAYLALTDG